MKARSAATIHARASRWSAGSAHHGREPARTFLHRQETQQRDTAMRAMTSPQTPNATYTRASGIRRIERQRAEESQREQRAQSDDPLQQDRGNRGRFGRRRRQRAIDAIGIAADGRRQEVVQEKSDEQHSTEKAIVESQLVDSQRPLPLPGAEREIARRTGRSPERSPPVAARADARAPSPSPCVQAARPAAPLKQRCAGCASTSEGTVARY